MFLKCRSRELVEGGSMVLTLQGRSTSGSSSNGSYYVWELLAKALKDMALEVYILLIYRLRPKYKFLQLIY